MQQGGASSSTDMPVDPVGPERLMTSPAGEGKMSVDELPRSIEVWVNEVGDAGEEEEDEKNMQIMQEAGDDVHGGDLPIKDVKAARKEEIEFMEKRGIWHTVKIEEC